MDFSFKAAEPLSSHSTDTHPLGSLRFGLARAGIRRKNSQPFYTRDYRTSAGLVSYSSLNSKDPSSYLVFGIAKFEAGDAAIPVSVLAGHAQQAGRQASSQSTSIT